MSVHVHEIRPSSWVSYLKGITFYIFVNTVGFKRDCLWASSVWPHIVQNLAAPDWGEYGALK